MSEPQVDVSIQDSLPGFGVESQGEVKAEDSQSEHLSEWDSCFHQVSKDPYNPSKWYRILELAEKSGDVAKIRAAYDGVLSAYPNTTVAQVTYIDHFLRGAGPFNDAEELFKKFLRMSSSVELWKHYLSYVKKINNRPENRATLLRAYEYALTHVGHDKDSGSLWTEYMRFIKNTPEGANPNAYEEQQKMDLLRKAYHRAVQIPLENVEQLWSELEAFEIGLNRTIAKKHMSDLMPGYMQARQVLRNLQRQTAPLNVSAPTKSVIPGLYLPARPSFTQAERNLVNAWKAYLKYEESNPLEMDDKEKAQLHARIQAQYRKACVQMRFFPEIWYMFYMWHRSIGQDAEAEKVLKAGLEPNPTSFVLNYAQAEALEVQKKFSEVHDTYKRFIELLEPELEEVESRTSSANTSLNSDGSMIIGNNSSVNVSSVSGMGDHTQASQMSSQGGNEGSTKSKEFIERRKEYGVVWIDYMRFARRAEGLQAARDVFKNARKSKWTPWEVYEASAMLEYHNTKRPDISIKVFEMGMKGFGDDPHFTTRYLNFLLSVNDEANARALFETLVSGPSAFPPGQARPIWDRWARYVYQHGDLATALEMEKRIAEAFPNDPPIKRFAQRYGYVGIDTVANRDLGFGYRPPATITTSGTSASTSKIESPSAVHSNSASSAERKRGPSPDRRREEERKRQRPLSPPLPPRDRDRDRDRDYREGPPRRRFSPPPPRDWERRERDEPSEKQVTVPPVLNGFLGQLPPASTFNGPSFRPDDLMSVFRGVVIPASGSKTEPSAPPPRGATPSGRPPPDYGPYQGPSGGPRRRW